MRHFLRSGYMVTILAVLALVISGIVWIKIGAFVAGQMVILTVLGVFVWMFWSRDSDSSNFKEGVYYE